MFKEIGRVIEVDQDRVKIVLRSSDCCSKCNARSLCQLGTKGERILEARNNASAKLGDDVMITVKPRYALSSLFLLFGLPILMGVMAIIIARRLNSDIWSAALGIAGIGAGLVIAKIFDIVLAGKKSMLPEITRIYQVRDTDS